MSFPTPIALEPGRTHVIEALTQGPGNPMLAESDQIGSCPGIGGIFQGKLFSNGADFRFRSGIDLTPVVPGTWGRLKAQYR